MKVGNYLDVTFNLNDGSYRPYQKTNDETHYIHILSDHTTSQYKQHLASCGYNEKLTYQQQRENNENTGKNRKGIIIWFKPPYSKSLKTNIHSLERGTKSHQKKQSPT